MNDFPVPRMSRNCLGIDCRLLGQKREPMPPAMMTQYLLLAIMLAVMSDCNYKDKNIFVTLPPTWN